ncbi:MAG: hypothetical protein CMJ31_01920 [Phycisphaerae bacterium]|nr:hypothetical protein [Phycisphaerae bacterium]
MTQTTTLLVDAYRELNAKKLFWIAIGLNVLMIAIYAGLGINERGVTFFHWGFESPFNEQFVSKQLFYELQFVTWGVPFLTWVSTILALISTAAMIPDMITGGSIEMLLSKPMGRIRLLLTKFATGLLFVAMQVLVFSGGCFLVLWLRGGVVEPSLFLAVPIVVLFFSYLFCVCVLLGLLTRSTIATLLLTVGFWVVVFIVNSADDVLLLQRESAILRLEDAEANLDRQIALSDRMIQNVEARDEQITTPEGEEIKDLDERRNAVNIALGPSRQRLVDRRESVENWTSWSSRVTLLKVVFPKTQETIQLLTRHLISEDDLNRTTGASSDVPPPDSMSDDDQAFNDPRVAERVDAAKRDRSLAWVLGTSVGFELFILGIACVIFVRRDF